ncbi:hypothetical protein QR680_012429 [Steinernema hermaphroditum]|uniref:Serpin domain-containing protein n=1 Tax=Steinernema hermaphroditum TaxID=289476 RepID=A0AA39M0H9_9BILA|nr:hypothetical protein QR680_012429 [Steinernema hermaphroditum]
MPKFRTESDFDVVESLKALGVQRGFDDDADFGGIANQRMAINSLVHKLVTIEADEKGVTVAASSAFKLVPICGMMCG